MTNVNELDKILRSFTAGTGSSRSPSWYTGSAPKATDPFTTAKSSNTSWFLGSGSSHSTPSTITSVVPLKTTSISKQVAGHFGINFKTLGDISAAKKSHSKPTHESILGSILGGAGNVAQNLTTDIVDSAIGFGPGIIKLATTNPVDTAKAIGHDYATRYGKLFQGDIGGFASDVGKHPLGYLLDASTLGTGGGAILGRLAPELAKGGEVGLRLDRAAVKAGDAVPITRQLSQNVFTRKVFEQPAYAIQKILPQGVPLIGERGAATRQAISEAERISGLTRQPFSAFKSVLHDIKKLDKHDANVTHSFDAVSSEIQHRPLQLFGQQGHANFNIPKPAATSGLDFRFHNADTRVHSPEISGMANLIKGEITLDAKGGIVAKDGASTLTNAFVKMHNAQTTLAQSLDKNHIVPVIKSDAVARNVAKTPKWWKTVTNVSSESKKANNATIENGIPGTSLGGKFNPSHNEPMLPNRPNPDFVPAKVDYKSGKFTPSKGTPRLPAGPNPDYVPGGATYNAGVTPVARTLSKGSLLAQSIAKQTGSDNTTFLAGVKRSDTISDPIASYLEMTGSAVNTASKARAKAYLGTFGENKGLATELQHLFDKKGPQNALSSQFDNATQVWKDAILLARPAFFANVLTGNQLLYHMKNGLGGISYFQAVKGQLNKVYDKHFFEHKQSLGSLEARPAKFDANGVEIKPGFLKRMAGRGYSVESGHEQLIRKATMREAALAIPAIKTEYRRLISSEGLKGPEAFSKAVDHALATPEGAGYRELIARAIDNTAGNYRRFNTVEQGIRKVIPFYSWDRHITRTAGSMYKDTPGRANIVTQIGMMGQKENLKNYPGVPEFMRGLSSVAGHTIDAGPLNPMRGAADVLLTIKELVHGKPTAGGFPHIASALNPYILGAGQTLSGVNFSTGAPIKKGSLASLGGTGLIGSVVGQTVSSLPQTKIISKVLGFDKNGGGNRSDPHYFLTPTGQLQKKFFDSENKVTLGADGLPVEAKQKHMLNPTVNTAVLNWLGIPVRNVNLKTAQTVAKSIDSKLHPVSTFHSRKQTNHIKKLVGYTSTKHSSTTKTGWPY